MTGLGGELPLKNCGETANSKKGDAESDASDTSRQSYTPELIQVIENWGRLSSATQQAILAMINDGCNYT